MSSGRTATVMRIAAGVWLSSALAGVGIDLWQQSIWDLRDAGVDLDEILERIELPSWLNHANYVVGTAAIAIAASTWARGRPLVRVGQALLGLSLLVSVWLVMVRLGSSTIADFERLDLVATVNGVAFYVALAALVVSTRAPLLARIGFVVGAAAWQCWVHLVFDPAATTEPPIALFTWTPVLLAAMWSVTLWLAAPHEPDAPSEPIVAGGVDDPARLRAADGIALLRAGIIARIVLSVATIGLLVAMRQSGSAGMAVWLGALGHCVLAVVIGTGITRYAALPDRAIEPGHVTTVIACLAIAALLELYGATQVSALLDVVARAESGDFSDMPRLSELESMQKRAEWTGRIASVVGLVAAVSLAISLRQTALWLDDIESSNRASTLVVLTILCGGIAAVLVAVAQSGALRGLEAIAFAMLAALALAITVLVLWLRLLGALAAGLRRIPTPS